MAKKPKRPRDPNQLAKFITEVISGERVNDKPDPDKNAGQREGGMKGGAARAKKLNAKQRSEIAKKAAQKRWGKS